MEKEKFLFKHSNKNVNILNSEKRIKTLTKVKYSKTEIRGEKKTNCIILCLSYSQLDIN